MAKPGRKPKPTALKELEGNPGKRKLNTAEPKPLPITPKCPSWLKKEEKALWDEYIPVLERMGVLTEADNMALISMFQVWAMAVQLWKKIKAKGELTTPNVRGGTKPLAEFTLYRQCLDILRPLWAEFGLTPSSRSRINLPPPETDDPLEEFFRD